MAEVAKDIPTKEDLKKLATKEELKDALRDVVRKKDLEKLATKKDLGELSDPKREKSRPGLKSWFSANWAGVVVAFIALLTSIYSGYETRRHARLSVRPHISLGFYANDKGAGWARTISGLGPAIINAFEVTVDGKPVQTWDAVLVAFGIDPRGTTGRLAIPTPGTYLLPSADGTGPLFWLESPPAARAALVKNANRVQIRLAYCSLYDECWERS